MNAIKSSSIYDDSDYPPESIDANNPIKRLDNCNSNYNESPYTCSITSKSDSIHSSWQADILMKKD